jgi:hypothetical protein
LTKGINVITFISLKITFDSAKRAAILANRGLISPIVERLFEGNHATRVDDRFAYGEVRQITAGWLDGRMVVFV